jgi:hypothetical protein
MFQGEQKPYSTKSFSKNGSKVTIPSNMMSMVNYNEHFFIVVSATFVSTRVPNLKQDLSIIYKLKWAT